MKVLYQEIGLEEGIKLTEPLTSDVQDINMPTKAIEVARERLKSSNDLLPQRERSFKDWNSGLLERWSLEI